MCTKFIKHTTLHHVCTSWRSIVSCCQQSSFWWTHRLNVDWIGGNSVSWSVKRQFWKSECLKLNSFKLNVCLILITLKPYITVKELLLDSPGELTSLFFLDTKSHKQDLLFHPRKSIFNLKTFEHRRWYSNCLKVSNLWKECTDHHYNFFILKNGFKPSRRIGSLCYKRFISYVGKCFTPYPFL